MCREEGAWDLDGAELINPLTAQSSIRISSDPKGAGYSVSERNRQDLQAAQEWSLSKIRDTVRGNMRVSRLVKITCSNCRYALLLDHVKIREDAGRL